MVRAGLDLDGELLALARASHSGEAFHLDGVRRILARRGPDRGRPAEHPRPPVRRGASARSWIADGRPASARSRRTAPASTRRCSPPASSTAGTPRPTATRPTRSSRRSRETLAELTGEPSRAPSRSTAAARRSWRSRLDRPGPRVRPDGRAPAGHRTRPRSPTRSAPPRVPRRHRPRRHRADPGDARPDRQGRRRVASMPWGWPTVAASRSRSPTATRAPSRSILAAALRRWASSPTAWPSSSTRAGPRVTASRSAPSSPSGSERPRARRPAAGDPRRGLGRRRGRRRDRPARAASRWSA